MYLILLSSNRFWLSVVCTLIDTDIHHHSGQHVALSWSTTNIIVNESTDNAKAHLICFIPQYQHQRKCLFKSMRAEKGIL